MRVIYMLSLLLVVSYGESNLNDKMNSILKELSDADIFLIDDNSSNRDDKKKGSTINNNPKRDSSWNLSDFYIVDNNDSNSTVIEEEVDYEK